MTARRVLLSTTALELVRRRVLRHPLVLPPGFGLAATGSGSLEAAVALLHHAGVALPDGDDWRVQPAVAADLLVLACPELAVTVRAARPGLDVHACVAVSGPRAASLLRTGPTAVQLSALPATGLADELARVVPAPTGRPAAAVEEVPLDVLLGDAAGRLRGRVTGALHASVVAPRAGGAVGSVEWVWDGAGWTGLEALPSRGGRPWVRLVPAVPGDLGAWLAPLLAAAAA